jgi:murein DD-endopeptidase MepM/ murein hydrolase activator NlpD
MPRRPAYALTFLALAPVLIGLWIVVSDRAELALEPPQRPPGPTSADTPVTEVIEPPLDRVETSIGRRGTLAAALARLEAPAELRPGLIQAIGESLDLRRLNPATGLLAEIDDSGRWRTLAIRPRPDRFLRIEFGDGGTLQSDWVDLPLETEVMSAVGTVDLSVAQSLSESPHAIPLVAGYADIFQWDVDLLVEPRKGDEVRVVYEVHRLGPQPSDLPTFDDAPSEPGGLIGVGKILAASYRGEIASAHAFWVSDGNGGGDYFDLEGRPLRKTFLKSPLNYRRISSGFSRARRNPVTRRVVPHHGIDYAAAPGTPVVAAADGRVVSAGWDGALGKAVRIRHGSEYVTIYGHLQATARGIKRGTAVRQNQVIGFVGSTGRATGPHLHYTMIHRGRPVDPRRIENPRGASLEDRMRPELDRLVRQYADRIDLDVRALAELRPSGSAERLIQ